MDLKLDGKVALITGSSKEIGEAIARGLAREKAVVVVHGRSRNEAERVAKDISSLGGQTHAVVGDLTDDDEVQRLVGEAQALAGPINILINNAGGSGAPAAWSNTRATSWAS